MRVRVLLIVCCGLLSLPAWSQAQPPAGPTSKLAWDQPAGTLAEASAMAYDAFFDGAVAPSTLTGVVCTGAASPFVCSAPFPALTPAAHGVTLAARNAAGSSPVSAVFNFIFVALPQAPRNLRIVAGN